MEIGEFLGQVRGKERVTIKAVASTAGVDPSFVSRVETGSRVVTNQLVEAYAIETGHSELKLLNYGVDVESVYGIYRDRNQAKEVRRWARQITSLA